LKDGYAPFCNHLLLKALLVLYVVVSEIYIIKILFLLSLIFSYGTENLYMRMERMISLEPMFIDVTWGACGSTKELTMAISQYSQTYFGTDVMMHLTCTNLTIEKLQHVKLVYKIY
jgi:hypothetical protein